MLRYGYIFGYYNPDKRRLGSLGRYFHLWRLVGYVRSKMNRESSIPEIGNTRNKISPVLQPAAEFWY